MFEHLMGLELMLTGIYPL